MTDFNLDWSAALKAEDESGFRPIPEDSYTVIVKKAEAKPFSTGSVGLKVGMLGVAGAVGSTEVVTGVTAGARWGGGSAISRMAPRTPAAATAAPASRIRTRDRRGGGAGSIKVAGGADAGACNAARIEAASGKRYAGSRAIARSST